jgi:hypothetical protein
VKIFCGTGVVPRGTFTVAGTRTDIHDMCWVKSPLTHSLHISVIIYMKVFPPDAYINSFVHLGNYFKTIASTNNNNS